ncbi:hypothetical protein KM043_004919 [Ampulex compressa]|nr:hypothetical protein KM043_004919 [Ampulex compressa]
MTTTSTTTTTTKFTGVGSTHGQTMSLAGVQKIAGLITRASLRPVAMDNDRDVRIDRTELFGLPVSSYGSITTLREKKFRSKRTNEAKDMGSERDERTSNDISIDESEILDFVRGKRLTEPVLGNFYRIPDLPTSYVEPTVLDTSLPHIAIYAHLKVHAPRPVQRPQIPSILTVLRSKSL